MSEGLTVESEGAAGTGEGVVDVEVLGGDQV
jgi:hypothetical protein